MVFLERGLTSVWKRLVEEPEEVYIWPFIWLALKSRDNDFC